ncbi:uncharacterized protein LOC9643713 isoform X2 [Selaginella moellendorffii]|uniref:uncharacterized protein LOC9643713 isoform X2 n=1 Tax=Selaginella moellendorffii TaxID=88036 RepID=UPI000D1D0E78|nr:uncharacterized protein LOC9643713 isoform X2 [Selaginella moellendorffii]|eukprot:XP_024524191.1 uncharacterized protein LOC9643713 isoform X2 [Selaginella moellendorffii]
MGRGASGIAGGIRRARSRLGRFRAQSDRKNAATVAMAEDLAARDSAARRRVRALSPLQVVSPWPQRRWGALGGKSQRFGANPGTAFQQCGVRCFASSGELEGDEDSTQASESSSSEDEAVEEAGSSRDQPGKSEAAAAKEDVKKKAKEKKSKEEEEAAFQAMKARFRKEFESRIVKNENLEVKSKDLEVSLDGFSYYLDANTRELLLDCSMAHLRQPEFMEYSQGLPSSSQRILLHGPSGSQIYQEQLVKSLAHKLDASFLTLDSTILSPHDYGDQDVSGESELDHESRGRESRWTDNESDQDASDEEDDNDGSDSEEPYRICALLEVAEASYKHKHEGSVGSTDQQEESGSAPQIKLKKGDRVRFVGSTESRGAKKRQSLKKGQRGWVISTPKGLSNNVGVRFISSEKRAEHFGRSSDESATSFVNWCHLTELELDDGPVACAADEWVAALEALAEVSESYKPLVVYIPDPEIWFERAVPLAQRRVFLEQVEERLDKISGAVVLIASRSNDDPEFERRSKLAKSCSKWRNHTVNLEDIYHLFVNTVNIYPPQDEKSFEEWKQRLEHDKTIYASRKSIQRIQKVLELHNLECQSLPILNTLELYLPLAPHWYVLGIEKAVGWALNHYLSSCSASPSIDNGKLSIPLQSLERALAMLKAQDGRKIPATPTKGLNLSTVAEDKYEKALISSVIPSGEIGVLFTDVGALEDVKKALQELVILPLQRPELFKRGNLTKPCRGVLLFGPPGTGKTLLAKAVATEAGANFISITSSTISSKWFGDAEKLTKALFSLAKKLSPTVVFVDEVDSLLGARGGSSEHEVTRRVKNEFMAAWDGLRTKDDERIIVLAATNRPFDLDDAVIRRLPRRILIDLPQASSRVKILGAILLKENLEPNFDMIELAKMTEGYSGSDLKNLSIAAAYRPIREFLGKESELKQQGICINGETVQSMLRPITLDDFRQSMTQVCASVAFDALSMNELRHWNEQYGEGGSRKKRNFGFMI